MIGVCFAISLISCGEPPTNDLVLLFDVTNETVIQQIEQDQITDYLLEEVLELSQSDLKRQEVNVTISSIGSTSIQYTKTVSLKSGGSFLARTEKDRDQEIEDFKYGIHSQIERIAKLKKGLEHTVVMENLCTHFNELSASKADKKAVVAMSDLLQNTEQLSFYNYRNQPDHILDNYETLAAKMDHLCLLPSLDNITLTVIFLPTEQTDKLFQAGKIFWERYLESYGADVLFRPNI